MIKMQSAAARHAKGMKSAAPKASKMGAKCVGKKK